MQAHLLPQIDCSSRALAPPLGHSLQNTANVLSYANNCTPAGSGSTFSSNRFALSSLHLTQVVEMQLGSPDDADHRV